MSKDQVQIIKTICSGKSVMVNAAPGSGKTQTVLELAARTPGSYIIQLTYNKLIQIEVDIKAKSRGLQNLKIFTYHGFANRFYAPPGINIVDDISIKNILYNKLLPKLFAVDINTGTPGSLCGYVDIIVLDETQDMIPEYYLLISKFIRDVNFKGELLILGDSFQNIYEFRGSDHRFLTLARELFPNKSMFSLTLSETFRCTSNVASFVNTIYRRTKIVSNKPGPPVIYFKSDLSLHENIYWIAQYIINLIQKHKLTPGDIFILMPSMKTSPGCAISTLENILVKNGYACYYNSSDESFLISRTSENKIVFTTYHQSKGQERACCIIWNFDNSYFRYYNKNADPYVMPNEHYVAITRSSKHLLLVADSNNDPLPYMCAIKDMEFLRIYNLSNKQLYGYEFMDRLKFRVYSYNKHIYTVTDLIKFIPVSYLYDLNERINKVFKCITPGGSYEIIVPKQIGLDRTYEDVHDLTGTAIAYAYEFHVTSKINSRAMLNNAPPVPLKLITPGFTKAMDSPGSAKYFLALANLDYYNHTGLLNRMIQITDYDWLSENSLEECIMNLHFIINANANSHFEKNSQCYLQKRGISLIGKIDVISDKTLWEIKCTDTLKLEHKLQLVLYSYITPGYDCKLVNARTGEIFELVKNYELINEIVDIILESKLTPGTRHLDDESFVDYLVNN